MRYAVGFLFALALALALSAGAGEYQPLQGSVMLGGKTLLDPPAGEPQNTHLYFFLTGASARTLYEALDVSAVYDECRDDGSQMKLMGNMQCVASADGSEHQCTFGIDLTRQSIEPGSAC